MHNVNKKIILANQVQCQDIQRHSARTECHKKLAAVNVQFSLQFFQLADIAPQSPKALPYSYTDQQAFIPVLGKHSNRASAPNFADTDWILETILSCDT